MVGQVTEELQRRRQKYRDLLHSANPAARSDSINTGDPETLQILYVAERDWQITMSIPTHERYTIVILIVK